MAGKYTIIASKSIYLEETNANILQFILDISDFYLMQDVK
jgi:hypothetical protein